MEKDSSDVEFNSDFESIDGDAYVSESDNENDDENDNVNDIGKEIKSNKEIEKGPDLGKPISISVRAPDGAKFKIEQLRENSDSTELIQKLEDKNYSTVQYELIRAYPRQKIDLSPGQTLSDLKILNQDAFHLQLKM